MCLSGLKGYSQSDGLNVVSVEFLGKGIGYSFNYNDCSSGKVGINGSHFHWVTVESNWSLIQKKHLGFFLYHIINCQPKMRRIGWRQG